MLLKKTRTAKAKTHFLAWPRVLRLFICVGGSVGRAAVLLPNQEFREEFVFIKLSPPERKWLRLGLQFARVTRVRPDNEGDDSSQSSQPNYERIKLKINFLSCGDWPGASFAAGARSNFPLVGWES